MENQPNPKHKYAVIQWNAENVYRISDAVATYASEKLADKKADKLNDELQEKGQAPVYVTREMKYMI